MSRFLLLTAASFCLTLLACGPDERSEEAIDGPQTVEVDAAEAGYADRPGTDSLDADNSLALEPGLYVIEGSDCQDPANTGWRLWNGKGFQGADTGECTFELSGLEGEVYTGRQACGGGAGAELSIEVLEPGSIILTEGGETVHLTLCPDGEIPEWVETKLSARPQ